MLPIDARDNLPGFSADDGADVVAELFRDVDTWIFDLDNTLYPPETRLFEQIDRRMTAYVARTLRLTEAEADALRRHYFRRYGTTLAGLMARHGVEPEAYLAEVHDIDLSSLNPDHALREAIATLPGRKIIHTNGSAAYARRIVAARGLAGVFDRIYGIEHAGFQPKPKRDAFVAIIDKDGLEPRRAAMFEDDPRNLLEPFTLGMRTVHVAPTPVSAPHIHVHTADLAGFLGRIGQKRR